MGNFSLSAHHRSQCCRMSNGHTWTDTHRLSSHSIHICMCYMFSWYKTAVVLDQGCCSRPRFMMSYIPRWLTHPQMVIHPSTNLSSPDICVHMYTMCMIVMINNNNNNRVTSLIETMALPLSQTTTCTKPVPERVERK